MKCGALSTIAQTRPLIVPTTGTVRTHPAKIQATARQLTERRSPLQSATPTVAPVMHIVVETGMPYCDARTVQAGYERQRPVQVRGEARLTDGDGRTELHREAARRRVQRDLVPEDLHDVAVGCC